MIKQSSVFDRLFGNVRTQLVLWNALFLIIIASILAVYFYLLLDSSLYKSAKSFLGHEAQEVASALKIRPLNSDLEHWIISELSQRPEYSVSYQIYDAQGKKISGSPKDDPENYFNLLDGNLKKQSGEFLIKAKNSKGENYFVSGYNQFSDSGNPLYYVLLSSRLSTVLKKLKGLKEEIFWMLPVMFLGALGFGWILAGISLSPIRKITQKIEAMTIENLDKPIKLRGSGDDLDRLAATFNKMLSRLHESYQRVSQFTSDASHELKTPIAVMKNQIEVSLGKSRDLAEYRELLVSHLEELDHLGRLVESMLFLARMDNHQTQLHHEKIEINQVFQELLDFFEPFQELKNIQLIQKDSPIVTVQGDRILFKELLINLMDNAIRYNRPNGKVIVECGSANHSAIIKVSDTGCGIKPEYLDKIFDRFFRVDSSRSEEVAGQGLGLAICKAIVKAHGGTLQVSSIPDQGTEFTVTLPL